MAKKLTKTGNSYAVVLDRNVLEAAGIDASTELEVMTEGRAIVITPAESDKKRAAKFKAVMARINADYGPLFKRLAK